VDELKARIKEKLLYLTAVDGVSGREGPVVQRLSEVFGTCADRVEVDRMGNVFAYLEGREGGPLFMICAHCDEIGAIVQSVEPQGFIRFRKVGGTVDALLPARKVSVSGRLGVIGVRPGHLLSPKERTEVRPASELYIDVGAASAAEVAALGIKVGDPIAFKSEVEFFPGGQRFAGKALDNRLGCSVLWEVFQRLAGTGFPGTVAGVLAVQEEVGLRGAMVAAYRLDPEFAVALDTIPAGDTPDVAFHRELAVAIGRGPVLQLASGNDGWHGLLLNPIMERLVMEAAQENDIPLQRALFPGNTDASAIHLARAGIPCAPITLPRRYAHSPVELADLNDAAWCTLLLEAVVRKAPEARTWTFV